jgi:small-conductance mechanosensitive channel
MTIGLLLVLAMLLGLKVEVASQESSSQTPEPAQIIQFLGQTIDWYRQTEQEGHLVSEPVDLGFLVDNQRTSTQIVKLAFEFARAQEQQLAKQKEEPSNSSSGGPSSYESLRQTAAAADQLVQQTQSELDGLKQKSESASPAVRHRLEVQISELQSELGLYQARQQALHGMLDFASGASGSHTSLRSQIEELAKAVPFVMTGAGGTSSAATSEPQRKTNVGQAATRPEPSGIWGLTADVFKLSGKRNTLAGELRATEQLQQSAAHLRGPLVSRLKQLLQQGDSLAKQADTSDQSALIQEKQQLDELTTQFRQVSGELTSLGKQGILLNLYKGSLANWQNEVSSEIKERVRSLLARLFVLAIALGAVFLVGELWRRAIFRYVHDVRRRYQFLLIRRISLWCCMAIVLLFAFVTELGAVATFAGLITAGVAVALQNVIVSIVGYFFLIGKFGIRVGDRVQVGTVSGEVVDIGLVRFHLMELAGGTTGAEPTGRVVAFSNSVVFQSTGGLFKQIPGTNFIWREVVLRFSNETDYRTIRDRLQKAMDNAYADYADNLERQRRQMELSLSSILTSELKPRVQTYFTSSAVEVTLRYPVLADKAGDIDEHVLGEIFSAIDREPNLKLIESRLPVSKTAP